VGHLGPSIALERRLVGDLWLLSVAEMGHYGGSSQQDNDSTWNDFDSTQFDSSHFSGGLGLRYVVTPNWVVALSLFGMAHASYNITSNSSAHSSSEGKGYSAGGQLGLAIERDIVPGFGVRLATAVVHFSFSHSDDETEYGGQVNTYSSSGWSGGLALSPTLALVFRF